MQVLGLDAATSTGTPATTGASNVKGSWVSLGTADDDYNEAIINCTSFDNARNFLIDLEIGGNIVFENAFSNLTYKPCKATAKYQISSGDAVRVRGQSNIGSLVFNSSVTLTNSVGQTSGTVASTYAALIGNSRGTAMAVTTINTEQKTELTLSGGLNEDTDFICLCLSPYASGPTGNYIAKLYVDATGSTDAGIGCQFYRINYGEGTWYNWHVDRTVFASGTRVWLGLQADTISGNPYLGATLHGWQVTASGGGGGLIPIRTSTGLIQR